ncbi:MAG: O-antigen ligase family protein [Anaerolineae bacterium]|nr:O-antigen ligase family protein [Anaerolineae bacterium]
MPYAFKRDLRPIALQTGIGLSFALMACWMRLIPPPFGAPDLNVTRFALFWAMLATILVWLASGAPGFADFRRSRMRALWAITLLLLAIWAYASQAWAFTREIKPEASPSAGLGWCIVALFTLVVACAAQRRILITLMLVAGSFVALVTLVQVGQQSSLGLHTLGEFQASLITGGKSILSAGDWHYLRPSGLYPHPNMLGGLLAICTLFASARAVNAQGRARLVYLGLLILILAALLLTFSRSAWLGLAVGGLALWLMLRLGWHRWLPVVLAGAVTGAIFFAAYSPLIAARTGVGEESVELRSVSDRIVFTDFALRAIREQSLIGQGVGAFPWRSADYITETFYDLLGDQVHQIFLAAWAEMGLVGLILFGGGLLLGLAGGLRALGQDRLERAPLLAAALALIVIGQFDHYPYSQLPLMALWWGCLAAALRP